MKGRRMRGPDRRPRLQPGQLRCGECNEPMPEKAAAYLAGTPLHPINCLGQALSRGVAAVQAAVEKAFGASS